MYRARFNSLLRCELFAHCVLGYCFLHVYSLRPSFFTCLLFTSHTCSMDTRIRSDAFIAHTIQYRNMLRSYIMPYETRTNFKENVLRIESKKSRYSYHLCNAFEAHEKKKKWKENSFHSIPFQSDSFLSFHSFFVFVRRTNAYFFFVVIAVLTRDSGAVVAIAHMHTRFFFFWYSKRKLKWKRNANRVNHIDDDDDQKKKRIILKHEFKVVGLSMRNIR